MNQLCKVCGEPAAGFHFGAFTCEGCKSFFGRTYNNLSSISECKNNGECVINKKNRTACKACRLRKCLVVGMSKSGSRYGRRSNWFKIHCLLQEQQGANIAAAAAAANLLRPSSYLSPFFRPPGSVTGAATAAGPAATTRDPLSSESDSGASSADPDDDLRVCRKLSLSPSSVGDTRGIGDGAACSRSRPASAAIVPRWLPPRHGVADPAAWRDAWLHGPFSLAAAAAAATATAAPDQVEPIDLSKKKRRHNAETATVTTPPDSDNELSIDVGVEEPVKSVPLDLTLDRPMNDVGK